jgi:hypothetical protein
VRAAYVNRGGPNVPDQDKARLMGVDQFVWDAVDPVAPIGLAALLATMRGAGWRVAINRNTKNEEWPDSETDPAKFGTQLSLDLSRLQCDYGRQCSVVMDVEQHDAAWVETAIRAFRHLRPGRYLYWTLEPLQAGWITPTLRDLVNLDPLTWIVPQMYRGSLAPVSERAVVDDLTGHGFNDAKVKVYYDRWYEDFNGIVFGAF